MSKSLLTLATAFAACGLVGNSMAATVPGDERTTVQLVRLSRSDVGGDIYHCINAGLHGYPQLQVVDQNAEWQVKIAVTTRPFLAPGTRLVHLTVLHRLDPSEPAPVDYAYPVVEGYQIETAVIRPISVLEFADTCYSIARDLVYRHIER